MWSAEYVKQHPEGFNYQGYSAPLKEPIKKKSEVSYPFYQGFIEGVEKGCDYNGFIFYNASKEILDCLSEGLREVFAMQSIDLPVYGLEGYSKDYLPWNDEQWEGYYYYYVDVGGCVECGLVDLEKIVSTQRRIA